MADPIDFYFDFASPYGYLAAQRVDELAADHGREVAWRPILIGPALKRNGTTPLMDQPLKGPYVKRDLRRMARLMEVPFTDPPTFPFAALGAVRGFYWIADTDPTSARAFARAVYNACWGEGLDVTDVDVLGTLADALGIDAQAMLAAIQTDPVKERAKAEVDASLEKGVFGSPFFIVDGEPFWGADRMDMIDLWLESGGW